MLTVNITSFSFRRGYPIVNDEHGGGFVFDCRSICNPGREPQYKHKSGLDKDVIKYIENYAETEEFYNAVRTLILGSIKTYLERGYTTLHIGFGCTGGQHRSVYFAERLNADLSKVPQVKPNLLHRESSYWGQA